MNDLNPVAEVHRNSAGQIIIRNMDGSTFDISKHIGAMVVDRVPDTHRVVSVDLLATIDKAFVDYEMAVGDAPPYPHIKMMKELRAIIDNKEE